MTEKELISVRLETDTKQRVEEYADEHGVSRSVAIRRLLDKGVDLEEAGIAVAASRQTGNEDEGKQDNEGKAMTDGGPVARPALNLVGVIFGTLSLLMFGALCLLLVGIKFPFVDYVSLMGAMTSGLLVTTTIFLILYTEIPEDIDVVLYAKTSGIRSKLPSKAKQ
jgi:predicted transcriptional regulator